MIKNLVIAAVTVVIVGLAFAFQVTQAGWPQESSRQPASTHSK